MMRIVWLVSGLYWASFCAPLMAQLALSQADVSALLVVPNGGNTVASPTGFGSLAGTANGGMTYFGGTYSGGTNGSRYVRTTCSVGAGRWEVYVRGYPTTSGIVGRVDIDFDSANLDPLLAEASTTFTTSPLPADASVTITAATGTTPGTYPNYAKVGEFTLLVGGTVYIRSFGRDTPGGGALRTSPIFFRKIADPSQWPKYIGGDVDTTGYFNNLEADDAVSCVILPAEQLQRAPTLPGGSQMNIDGYQLMWGQLASNPDFYTPTTQTGLIAAYVQLTFNDARYSASGNPYRTDAGSPTFGWIIALGRNGGMTARTVKADRNAGILTTTHDWEQTVTGAVGPPAVTGKWRCEMQLREVSRWIKYTKLGVQEGGPSWYPDGKFLSRFPFTDRDWYASPVFKSNEVSGTGAQGNTQPAAVVVGLINGHPQSTTPGDHGGLFTEVTVPTGYAINSTQGLDQCYYFRYPLHLNHLRCIRAATNVDPPVEEGARKFAYLIGKFIDMCDGDFTPAKYRAEVAKGAADTVTIEEDEATAGLFPGQEVIRPTIPTSANFNAVDMNRSTFNGAFPSGGTGAVVDWDLNEAFAVAGIPENSALHVTLNSDPSQMKILHAGTGWQNIFQVFDDYRIWLRAAMLFVMTVWFFWGKLASIWEEL